MKTICIYHSIDLDGWMSAAIVKLWWNFPENIEIHNKEPKDTLDFLGFNYGDSIPDLSNYDRVIMCDISFPKQEMFKLKDKLIWLDHHISNIKNVYGENKWLPTDNDFKGITDTKFAACELTWQYLFPNKTMPEIVRLLGRYDCFGHKGTDEEQYILEFQYGARQCISNYNEAYNYLIDEGMNFKTPEANTLNIIYEKGKSIYEYLCQDAKQSYKNGFKIELSYPIKNIEVDINNIPGKNATGFEAQINPFKFICINKERFNPINFGIDYHKDGYAGCACFYFDGKQYNFSLYNDNGLVDVSLIAKQFGGGGHKGASGFRIDNLNKIIK